MTPKVAPQTPSAAVPATAPAVYEWVARLWNARGSQADGEVLGRVPDDWGPILDAIGSAYLPYLCANAEAWKAGRRHGEGVQTWRSGSRYQGSWEEDNMHGLGAMIWWNGESFEGEFINDLGHGIGVCRTEEGAMAACEFTMGAFTRWVE